MPRNTPNPAPAAKPPRRADLRRMVVWLTLAGDQGGGGMSHRKLSEFFGHKGGGWTCHIAAGRWSAIRFTPEHALLLKAIYGWERQRAALPASVRAQADEVHRRAGELLREIDELRRQIARLRSPR